MPKFTLDNSSRFCKQEETYTTNILSFFTEKLLEKLISEADQHSAGRNQIYDDVRTWKITLAKIKPVLDDAEEKQMTDCAVKTWLGEIQNLAYDVRHILDEFETETLRRKLLHEPAQTSMLGKLFQTPFNGLILWSNKSDSRIASKVKEVTSRLQAVANKKDLLGLKQNSGGMSKKLGQMSPTAFSLPWENEVKVYGREEDKEEIVESLLRDDLTADSGFSVIPIIGMGGVGKTTLAQLVYNDVRVQEHFDLKAWACVSEDFNVTRITKIILRSINSKEAAEHNHLNLLQEQLKKKLSSKRFLLVLDDVWVENYNDWTSFSYPLTVGTPGSKIIVTTRSQGVAKMTGTIPAFQLKELSNDKILCVFTQHSLGTGDFSMHQFLKEIGEKIVVKCNGLPLAAKTLGSLLRGKYNPSDWEDVLRGKIWNLLGERCSIMPALTVSYYYLSQELKRCFAYCSLFPKDYEFQEDEIILLWMAEGFLHYENNDAKKMEDLGRKFFHELRSRSFFQQSTTDVSQFVMHDLVNDLAQSVAGEIYLSMEDRLEGDKQMKVSKNLRHLSYIHSKYDGDKRFEAFYDAEHLQTFLPILLSDTLGDYHYLAYSVLQKLLKLPRLRVLSLQGYRIFELPTSIGELEHLRYLNLSKTEIVTLPESVNKLYNLQTIKVEDCLRLKKLCADIGNLIKLLHLKNFNVPSLEGMPQRIGKLTSLQTLSSFVVGKAVGSRLQELKFLNHLRQTLHILRLENVKDASDAEKANLKGKKNLKALLLEWSNKISNSRESKSETDVLGKLKPNQRLKELTIRGYGGTEFPIWLGDSWLKNLVLLMFEGCGRCTVLPSVGQLPLLKHLFVSGMDKVKNVGLEFYGNNCSLLFPSLETLSFMDMQKWQNWALHGCDQEVEVFPKLRELSLINCPKLQGTVLPKPLPSLEKLVIRRCEQLLVSIPNLPSLCTLEIGRCKNVVWRSTIDPGSENSIVARNMSNKVFLSGLFKQELPRLEVLEIGNNEELKHSWPSETGLLQDISSIRRLKIVSCPRLLSLAAKEEDDQQRRGLPCRLQYLELIECPCLVKLPQAILSLSSLTEIKISECPSLISFPEAALPSQLRTIAIMQCNALVSLPDAWMLNINPSPERMYIAD